MNKHRIYWKNLDGVKIIYNFAAVNITNNLLFNHNKNECNKKNGGARYRTDHYNFGSTAKLYFARRIKALNLRHGT